MQTWAELGFHVVTVRLGVELLLRIRRDDAWASFFMMVSAVSMAACLVVVFVGADSNRIFVRRAWLRSMAMGSLPR